MQPSESPQENKPSQIASFKAKLTEFKELLLALGGIVLLLVAAMFWAQDVVLNREREILERNAELYSDLFLEKIIEKIDPLTADEFAETMQTFAERQDDIFSQAADFYLRNAMRQDTMLIDLEAIISANYNLKQAIGENKLRLDKIQGVTALSLQEQRAIAYTDSLQSVLTRLQNEQHTINLLRQMEQMHKKTIKEIKKKPPPETVVKSRQTKRSLRLKTTKRNPPERY